MNPDDYVPEKIAELIASLRFNDKDFDKLLTSLADYDEDAILTWVQEHFTISTPEGVETEDCKIEWA